MSIQLTVARAVARAAEADWNDHRLHCPSCERAIRSRDLDLLCQGGVRQRTALLEARAILKREQAADKAPIAGQEMLF